ncbi:2-dehydro-3-deoxygluconokinase [Novosphingobium chloroacetimidivorans]|uniref:2-dehydro-3-deoxygluconokinase n=2 Tax=Novosphingobium chloroacetimidivorans TaxID=1428314 RepID=A0A7W7KDG9_9SPHN|nr:2-dehydro-3-deoxygluconokinase [Novosphingobium chloroacetimidivorans]
MLRLSAPNGELLLQTPRLEVGVAGAEANVGVALAQLGHRVSMVSALPDTAVGDAPLQALRSHGIDCDGILRSPGRMGLYFVETGAGARSTEVIYDRAHSAFVRVPPEKWDWDANLAGAGRLHLSGITPALGERGTQAALRAAEAAGRAGVPVSFDGNYRAKLWESWDSDPRAVLTQLIARADVLFGNHRDIALLLDRPFSGDGAVRRREAAEAAFAAFPNLKLVACTARHVETSDVHRLSARVDRPDGWHETDEIVISGIVDRVGTGDAFAAGILHALACGADDAEVARFGLALARYKHSIHGDQVLIRSRDLAALLEEGKDVRR